MALAPEQFASLKRVLSRPSAKASAALGVPTRHIETFLRNLEMISRRGQLVLGQEKILVAFRPNKTDGKTFDGAAVTASLKAGKAIFALGNDETIVEAGKGTVSLLGATKKSEKEKSLCVICGAGQLWIFTAGKLIAEIGDSPPPITGRTDWRRSWRELQKSLDEHFEHCVDSEKGFRYWHDRKNRVLLVGPDRTEKLFHHSLFWWCNNFIVDAIDVHGEANAMGQDKTDITIVTEVGSIVIEVKWMGKNAKNTRYIQVRIKEGMIQVADYLNRNKRLMQGFLVIYDARDVQAHRTRSTYPKKYQHARCEPPVIYFLRSETPSEMAVRVAADKKG